MIHEQNLLFTLHTASTTYLFRVNETSHLEHLYYGRRIRTTAAVESLFEKQSHLPISSVGYEEEHPTLSLNNLSLEYSGYGKGDFREPAVLFEYGNGERVNDFVYKEHRILQGKPRSFSGLPYSYGDKNSCSTLIITLVEKTLPIRIELSYTTFDHCDVIVRKSAIINDMQESISLGRIASLQLDLPNSDYNLITFDGPWGRENQQTNQRLRSGIHLHDSKSGSSSSNHNPALFLTTPTGSECYGCNLIYSGDYAHTVEVSPYNTVRLISGLNPATFTWKLHSGEKFHSPEALLTFSYRGLNKASGNFHRFINTHLIRGAWKYRQRPISINTWEPFHYSFNDNSLYSLAKSASDLGVELFVLGDGWFGSREDESSSLGDWRVDTKKLPNGLTSLSKEIHKMGMLFGLWCEPEMISYRSELFKEHPEWVVGQANRKTSVRKSQYILDLTKEEVQDYLFETFSELWRSAKVDYVKWDFRRSFSDMHSKGASFNQNEFLHRYILGLYSLLERFKVAFPSMLFEGGNRFDLGMLSYMDQVSVSDVTDLESRVQIQAGSSYGYPLSTLSNYVTASPSIHTLRVSNLEDRFNVASFGVLGYQLDFTLLSKQERTTIKKEIEFYTLYRSLFQFGELHRLESVHPHQTVWVVSTPDKKEMLLLFYQTLQVANPPSDILRVEIADPELTYAITPRSQRIDPSLFQILREKISADRLQSDATLQRIVTIESEIEYYIVPGDLLAYHGVRLNQQYGGTGYDKESRVIGDFGSRIYHIKAL